MAKEAGTNVLLQVEDQGSPGSYITLKGQQSTEYDGGTETDDITDKSQSGWGSTLNVLRNLTVTVQGKADWPDPDGIDVIRNSWENGTDINCKLLLNAAGSTYTAAFQVTTFNIGGTHLNASEYNFTLQNNGAATYAAS